jgi:integrase
MAKTRNGEGSIRPRATKAGTVYDVQLTVRNRRTGLSERIFKGGFRTEKEAVNWRNATMQKSNAEGLVRAKPVTVPEVVLAWINSDATRAPTTDIRLRGLHKNHILPKLNVRVASLTERTMNEFLGSLTAGTAVNVMTTLKASFRWAAGTRVSMIDGNPLEDMPRLLKPRVERRKAMPGPEVAKLLSVSSGGLSGVLWQLLLGSGCRSGEALGLNWEDINLETGVVKVDKISSPETNGKNTAARTKGKRAREIYLPPSAIAILRDTPGGPGAGKEPLFKAPMGGRMRLRMVNYWWHRDCKLAGISGYVPHCLRHSWATTALEQHVPVNVVSSILGHASISTTLDIYAHETEAQKASAVNDVAAAFAKFAVS